MAWKNRLGKPIRDVKSLLLSFQNPDTADVMRMAMSKPTPIKPGTP